jgi:hypothetical protein
MSVEQSKETMGEKIIKAKEISINRLFSDDFMFDIPFYQRPLAWEWEPYLKEALEDAKIQKQLETKGFSKTNSGLGIWIIHEFLVNYTSFRFQHVNTHENYITIVDNTIKHVIDVYVKDTNQLWCEYCDSTDCEHVDFVFGIPGVRRVLKKRGWQLPEKS